MSAEQTWMALLRETAERIGQPQTAERIGYSTTVVNQVLLGKYKGDLSRVEERVKGALMGATVDCPIVGEITRDRCLDHQRAPFAATNPTRVQLWRACRGGCLHSLIAGGAGKESRS